jgi:hypothetical protein
MHSETADRISQLTESALEQLQANLAAGKSDTLKAYLATMAKFHRYSFGNQMLIAFQRPDAQRVAGFHTWRKLGRCVNKGEKGILIIAPCVRKCGRKGAHGGEDAGTVDSTSTDQREKDRKVFAFRAAFVFDVSQTTGADLPEFANVVGDPSVYQARLESLISHSGITFTRIANLGGALGLSSGGAIQILDCLDPASTFSVTVHEFAHELLHKSERRTSTTVKVRETEAEAVAFVVCHAIGLETGTAASDYLALYNGDLQTLTDSLELIRNTASDIISKLKVNEPVQIESLSQPAPE